MERFYFFTKKKQHSESLCSILHKNIGDLHKLHREFLCVSEKSNKACNAESGVGRQ